MSISKEGEVRTSPLLGHGSPLLPAMALALDPSSLSLSTGRGVLDPGKEVLQCWPHEYNSAVENQRWAAALPDWSDACGQRGGTKLNCGFEEFTMNYAGRADYLLDCGQDGLPGLQPPVLGMESHRGLP